MPVSTKKVSRKSPVKKTVSKKVSLKKVSTKKVSPAKRRMEIAKILAAIVGTAGVAGGAYKFHKGYENNKYRMGESRYAYIKDLIKNIGKPTGTGKRVNLNTVPAFGNFDKNTVYT